jgi:hypothetical protein
MKAERARSPFWDSRGAVLVIGLCMAAFVAYWLWKIMVVAEAIGYRERMQEAADATAFESAVWHARTMNLLAAVNMFMAGVMSILVMYRLIELIVGIALIVVGLLSIFIPPLAGIAELLADIEARLVSRDRTVTENVSRWLTRLNTLERRISSFGPVVDLVEPSVKNSAYFGSPVEITFPVSLAIIPALEQYAPRKAAVMKRMAVDELAPAMPVEEGFDFDLCTRAAMFWPTQISEALRRAGAEDIAKVVDTINDAVGTFAGFTSDLLCGGVQEAAQSAITDAATRSCDLKQEQFDADPNNQDQVFDHDKCMADSEKDVNQNDLPSTLPAAVWRFAHNGDVFFQVWAFAKGTPPDITAPGLGSREDREDFHWSVAEAEYYADCFGEEMKEWEACGPEAMWALMWTARLRRVRDPVSQLDLAFMLNAYVENVEFEAMGAIIQKLGQGLSKLGLPGPFGNPKVTSAVFEQVYWNSGIMEGLQKKQKDFIVHKLHADTWGQWMGNKLRGTDDPPTLIH